MSVIPPTDKNEVLNRFTQFMNEDRLHEAISMIVDDYNFSIFTKRDRKKLFEYIKLNSEAEISTIENNSRQKNNDNPTAFDLLFLSETSSDKPDKTNQTELLRQYNDSNFRLGYNFYEDKYGKSFPTFINDLIYETYSNKNLNKYLSRSFANRYLKEIIDLSKQSNIVLTELQTKTLLNKSSWYIKRNPNLVDDKQMETILDFFIKDHTLDPADLVHSFSDFPNVLNRLVDHAINLRYTNSKGLFRNLASYSKYESMQRMIDGGFSQLTDCIDIFAEQKGAYKAGGISMIMKAVTRKFSQARITKMTNYIDVIERHITYLSPIDENISNNHPLVGLIALRDELKEALELDLKKSNHKKVV